MDDAKIDLIAREVLTSLKKARAEGPAAASAPSPSPHSRSKEVLDPSLQLLSVVGGVVGQACVIEPDKVCVGSLKCRSFGH
ncbi:MAG: hypothetical protein KBH14_12130 [Vicinamibacteria bacterium]|jgi:hypothetical protein|nr:hypothetical protein [Vicinamibacteria bacterium]MBP9947143.1 hypothetical protein [Vicinamibacteria bacterium]